MTESTPSPNPQWHPHAAVAGWLVPGLGHIILGQRRRGIVLAIAIGSLYLAGLLIGGISVVDRYDRGEQQNDHPPAKEVVDRIEQGKPPFEYGVAYSRSWWFWGQAMIAPSIVIDIVRDRMAQGYAQQRLVKEMDSRGVAKAAQPQVIDPNPRATLVPGDGNPYEPSFGRVAEQGTLYTALAGMLNLLAMIDVVYCDAVARRRQFVVTPVRPGNIAGVQA